MRGRCGTVFCWHDEVIIYHMRQQHSARLGTHMNLYLPLAMFAFGYLVALIPAPDKTDPAWLGPLLSLIALVAALLFPITLAVIFVALRYERRRRAMSRGAEHA